jgi:rhodanese-related sulfurtransferase
MNKLGYQPYEKVLSSGLTPLNSQGIRDLEDDVLLLDTRNAEEFAKGFIEGSIYIGLEGQFAPWVGALIPSVKQKIALITPNGKEEETVRRLSRVGYDNVIGFLQGGIEAWDGDLMNIQRVDAPYISQGLQADEILIDVRKPGEYEAEHLENVPNIPLDFINERMSEFPKNKNMVLHCAGGYRSMIATSILLSRGFSNIKDIRGGFVAITKENLPTVKMACSKNS